MVDLFDKYRPVMERYERMLSLGVNALGVVNERVLSPTRAIGLFCLLRAPGSSPGFRRLLIRRLSAA